jgi:hypothetical protein
MKKPSLIDRIMHFDRFDTERYQKYLEARNSDLKTIKRKELPKEENNTLELLQIALYFILLCLTIIFLYRIA